MTITKEAGSRDSTQNTQGKEWSWCPGDDCRPGCSGHLRPSSLRQEPQVKHSAAVCWQCVFLPLAVAWSPS